MTPGEDSDFERQLLQMELRRPPAEWKALLLPPPPLFPKPLLTGLALCWSASLGFMLAMPEEEDLGPPVMPPPMNLPMNGEPLFALHSNETISR